MAQMTWEKQLGPFPITCTEAKKAIVSPYEEGFLAEYL